MSDPNAAVGVMGAAAVGATRTAVSVASIDGAVRKAQASGGISVLIRELEIIAFTAGVFSAPADGARAAPHNDQALIETDAIEEDAREPQLRLPTQGSKLPAGSARVLVEDVTTARTHAVEEQRAAAARAEFFTLRRFLPFAHKLVATVGVEWLPLMSDLQVVVKST